MQAELFEQPENVPSQKAARIKRDHAIARAEEGAEADKPGWTELAARHIAAFGRAIAHGQPFLIESAILSVSPYSGLAPREPRAWGAATRYAARRGWIAKAGYAPARSSNLSPKCLWKSG